MFIDGLRFKLTMSGIVTAAKMCANPPTLPRDAHRTCEPRGARKLQLDPLKRPLEHGGIVKGKRGSKLRGRVAQPVCVLEYNPVVDSAPPFTNTLYIR